MALLLRKLTRKSVIGFGRYSDSTVGMVLDYKKYPYLRWIYFNSSNITFMDDILDEINIPAEFRIEKPGVNREMGEDLQKIINGRQSGLIKIINDRTAKKIKRKKVTELLKSFPTKNQLRLKNHGH